MARVISDPSEAARVAASGEPVVLVGKDASAMGATVSSAADNAGRERLLAVMVGDPEDPAVKAAASEMASELFPWTGRAAPGPGLEPEPEPGLERREPGLEPGRGRAWSRSGRAWSGRRDGRWCRCRCRCLCRCPAWSRTPPTREPTGEASAPRGAAHTPEGPLAESRTAGPHSRTTRKVSEGAPLWSEP